MLMTAVRLCSLNVWRGGLLAQGDEPKVRSYWCVLEFAAVIRVRYRMIS